MKNAIMNNEYIENKNQVYDILKTKKFGIKYLGLAKMNKKDKNPMYHYLLTIGNKKFDYYEGLGHDMLKESNKYQKIINGFHCLLLDSDIINWFRSIDAFMLEYGYVDYNEALDIFLQCKDTYNKLISIFTREELHFLKDNINL